MIKINEVPCFRRGDILDSKILESLRDTPYEFYKLTYSNYSNGIISGVEVYADKNILTIKPGIIKFNDFYYRIKEEVSLDIPLDDGDYILKIEFFPKQISNLKKYYEYSFRFELDLNEVDENKIELARIKRREGAEIRNIEEFFGVEKEYNLVSEINKPQSTESGTLISATILKMFAKKMLERKETEGIDDSVCINILSNNFSRELIDIYILKKLNVDSSKSSNTEIYGYLSKIYTNLKDNKRVRENRVIRKTKMIVE